MSGTAPTPELPHIVLICEHDSGLRTALEFLLQAEGYRVQAVGAGEALLQIRLPDRDACLVVDQDLPGLSGLQTIEALRRRGVGLPAVLLTGRVGDVARLLGRQAHVQLVEKPLMGEALLNAIAAALA